MSRVFIVGFLPSVLLLSCAHGANPDPDVLTIEEVRVDRPWITETTELVPNTGPDDYEWMLSDFTDYPFVDDPDIIGAWTAVDIVADKEQFDPDVPTWTHTTLERQFNFAANGVVDEAERWTLGHVIGVYNLPTDSLYEIVNLDGTLYMFMQHKSGDYVFRFSEPSWYVYQKQ